MDLDGRCDSSGCEGEGQPSGDPNNYNNPPVWKDCANEQYDCLTRGTVVCGLTSRCNPYVGILCAAMYREACRMERSSCDAENVASGF